MLTMVGIIDVRGGVGVEAGVVGGRTGAVASTVYCERAGGL